MAKRVPPDEKPYRPVDDALVRSVLNPEIPEEAEEPAEAGAATATAQVVSFPTRQVEPKRQEAPAPKGREPAKSRKEENAPEPEKLTREKRFLLTPTEDRELERLVADMASELGTPLKPSHVIRAMVTVLRHADEELIKQSRRVGPLKRPPNGDATALAAFEHYLAQLIESGIRNSKPLK